MSLNEVDDINQDPAVTRTRFLSLALSVGANAIVSGDQKHLIPMHPHRQPLHRD